MKYPSRTVLIDLRPLYLTIMVDFQYSRFFSRFNHMSAEELRDILNTATNYVLHGFLNYLKNITSKRKPVRKDRHQINYEKSQLLEPYTDIRPQSSGLEAAMDYLVNFYVDENEAYTIASRIETICMEYLLSMYPQMDIDGNGLIDYSVQGDLLQLIAGV